MSRIQSNLDMCKEVDVDEVLGRGLCLLCREACAAMRVEVEEGEGRGHVIATWQHLQPPTTATECVSRSQADSDI